MNRKVLLIENFGEDFLKARIPLANFLKTKGYHIIALVPNDAFTEFIRKKNIPVYDYFFNRKNKGLIQILRLSYFCRKVALEENVDIIHSFRFQPNVLNCLANIFNKRRVICHITGLGIAFSNSSFKFKVLRFFSQIAYLFISIRANDIIVQNPDDSKELWFSSYFMHKVRTIPGSGVDVEFYSRTKKYEVPKKVKFICITRLLWEKGIKEMVEAFRELPSQYKEQSLLNIVGWADFDNPRAVSQSLIKSAEEDDNIFFLGKRSDVRQLLESSDVCLYPSYYREGIPRSLLESLSMGLPIITTDMPGCRLTVSQSNGLLIPPKSKESIKNSIITIIDNKEKLPEMSDHSRDLSTKIFSEQKIFATIELIYRK